MGFSQDISKLPDWYYLSDDTVLYMAGSLYMAWSTIARPMLKVHIKFPEWRVLDGTWARQFSTEPQNNHYFSCFRIGYGI
jgi:hypothetical protein